MITYRVRAEHLAEHLGLLSAVHDELGRRGFEKVGWDTYRREDGRSFVELVRTDAPGRFSSLQGWAAFRSTLERRCEAPPEVVDLELVARS